MTSPVLEIVDFSYTYPRSETPAIDRSSITLLPGECVCMTGPSGCGKSTLLLAIRGLLREGLQSGSINVNVPVVRDEVGIVFQNAETQILCTTVEEEVGFGPENLGFGPEKKAKSVHEALEDVGLEGFERRNVEDLSAGEKHRLTIASVLSMRPSLLLLDEPVGQLDASGKEKLVDILNTLKRRGHSLLIADHDLLPFDGLADRYVLMENGRIGKTSDRMPSFFRRAVSPRENKRGYRAEAPGAPAIQIKGLRLDRPEGSPILDRAEWMIPRGALAHIYGKNGAGKSTLLRSLVGLVRPAAGTVQISDIHTPRPGALLGKVGVLFQNPDRQLFEDTVFDEVAFSLRRLGLASHTIQLRVKDALLVCEVLHLAERAPLTLSHGEKHRVALASVIAPHPRILMLDEPFAGLDLEQRGRLLAILKEMRDRRGSTVLIASHGDLPDAGWADMEFVLENGNLEAA